MKPINPDKLRIRASQISKVAFFNKNNVITKEQEAKVKEFEARDNGTFLSKTGKPLELSDSMKTEWTALIEKKNAPDSLSTGGKTYVRSLFYEHVSGFKRTFSNKYTEKGNFNEKKEIAEACKYLKLPLVIKNEKYFENQWTHGTPDTILKPINLQMDVKGVYYPDGLDNFDEELDKEYIWQQKDYNWLTDTNHSIVAKVLLNPPEHILELETRNFAKDAGIHYNEITDEFREDVREYFNFEKRMPLEDRINVYTLSTTDKDIEQMKKGVELARVYYNELIEIWNSKNKNEVEFVKQLMETKR